MRAGILLGHNVQILIFTLAVKWKRKYNSYYGLQFRLLWTVTALACHSAANNNCSEIVTRKIIDKSKG